MNESSKLKAQRSGQDAEVIAESSKLIVNSSKLKAESRPFDTATGLGLANKSHCRRAHGRGQTRWETAERLIFFPIGR